MCSCHLTSSILVIEFVSFVDYGHGDSQLTSSFCLPWHLLTRLTGCSTLCWPDLCSANAALYQASTSSTYISKFNSCRQHIFCPLPLRGAFRGCYLLHLDNDTRAVSLGIWHWAHKQHPSFSIWLRLERSTHLPSVLCMMGDEVEDMTEFCLTYSILRFFFSPSSHIVLKSNSKTHEVEVVRDSICLIDIFDRIENRFCPYLFLYFLLMHFTFGSNSCCFFSFGIWL